VHCGIIVKFGWHLAVKAAELLESPELATVVVALNGKPSALPAMSAGKGCINSFQK
jgi:hypothetical protein